VAQRRPDPRRTSGTGGQEDGLRQGHDGDQNVDVLGVEQFRVRVISRRVRAGGRARPGVGVSRDSQGGCVQCFFADEVRAGPFFRWAVALRGVKLMHVYCLQCELATHVVCMYNDLDARHDCL